MFGLLENILNTYIIYIYMHVYMKTDHHSPPKKRHYVFHTFLGRFPCRGLRQHFLAAAKVFETPQFAELRLGNRAETKRLVLWHCAEDRSIKIIRIIRVIEMGTLRYLKILSVCVYGKHNDEANLYIYIFFFLEVPRHCQTETYNIEKLQLRRAVGLSSQPGFFLLKGR